jgi:hypothetical protein
MAKPKKLKVFRTPIGFHDAYVAAPSQKAALEAWGAGSNLFAQGAAEVVTDAKLTKAPLARPGEVVRVLRGSEAEQIRALGQARKAKGDRPSPGPARKREGRKARAPRPRSAAVDRAEQAIARAEERHRAALDKLRDQALALDKRRRELEREQRGELEKLRRTADEERSRYRAAMSEWAE